MSSHDEGEAQATWMNVKKCCCNPKYKREGREKKITHKCEEISFLMAINHPLSLSRPTNYVATTRSFFGFVQSVNLGS